MVDLKWAFEAVLWPPATKEARKGPLNMKQWLLLVGASVAMFCLSLFIGSFLMSFFDPITGKGIWIALPMLIAAAYYAYLSFVFGFRTKAV